MRRLYSSIEDIAIQRTVFLPQLKQRVSCPKLYDFKVRSGSSCVGGIRRAWKLRDRHSPSKGYKVAALSHRKSNRDYLSNLGADSVIDLSEFLATFRRPLESERWAGAIDSVVTSCQRCLAAWLIVAGLPVADWLEPASFLRRYFRLFCEEFD